MRIFPPQQMRRLGSYVVVPQHDVMPLMEDGSIP
jgi:hypothetical protein